MSTAGARLVELSGLPSGNAGAHLLAITAGGGTGTGATVFASRMTVRIERESLTLVRRHPRVVQGATEKPAPAVEQSAPERRRQVAVCVTPIQRFVVSPPIELVATPRLERSQAVITPLHRVVTRRSVSTVDLT